MTHGGRIRGQARGRCQASALRSELRERVEVRVAGVNLGAMVSGAGLDEEIRRGDREASGASANREPTGPGPDFGGCRKALDHLLELRQESTGALLFQTVPELDPDHVDEARTAGVDQLRHACAHRFVAVAPQRLDPTGSVDDDRLRADGGPPASCAAPPASSPRRRSRTARSAERPAGGGCSPEWP